MALIAAKQMAQGDHNSLIEHDGYANLAFNENPAGT